MKKVDAIIALGGGISYEGNLSESSRKRIDMSIDLYRQGVASHIIAAGKWSHRLQFVPTMTEAEAMRQRALENGVADEAITIEARSQDTIGNAFFIKHDILQPHNWRTLVVVTCGTHVARASKVFEHVLGSGYDVAVYPTLEIADSAHQHKEALGLIALSSELAFIPAGNDLRLAERFSYLRDAVA